ncbi:MAG: hypothetical protein HKN82_03705 [Akkermansiaceae bacterium]|nr:hypothetical protein [Akkermansiaceae bacterium]
MDYSLHQPIDRQHLRLLGLFHYVLSGFLFLGAFFMMVYPFIMHWALTQGGTASSDEDRSIIMLVGVFYGIFGLFSLALAICNIIAGRSIQRRRRKLFILIIAGINTLNIPLGTILAVFTFIVLLRPSVSAEFEAHATSPSAPPVPNA